MKKVWIVFGALTLFYSGMAIGQTKGPEVTAQDRIDILQAQLIVCKTQLSNNQVSATVQDLVNKIETKYAGYTLNLTNGNLQKKEEKPKAEKEK